MTTTPSRSPLGAFVRSPLGVRGGGKIELHSQGTGRLQSAVGGGYSFACCNFSGIGSILPVNLVKSPTNMRWHTVSPKSSLSRWINTAVRCAYFNGVYAVFGYNSESSEYVVYTSTDRKSWSEKIAVSTTPNFYFPYDGFASTPSGFFAWGDYVPSTVGRFLITSSDGISWSYSITTPKINTMAWNPMIQKFTISVISGSFPSYSYHVEQSEDGTTWSFLNSGTREPWTYGYDSVNSIMIGIGKTNPKTIFGTIAGDNEEDSKIYTTTNGTSWSLVHTHTSDLIFCAAGGGQMIAGNTTSILYSSNSGTSWSSADAGTLTSIRTITADYKDGYFVLHGAFSDSDSLGGYSTSVAILKNGVISTKRPNVLVEPA